MNIDKDALRKAAEAATKGPWFLRLSDNATPHIMHGKDPIHGGIPEIDELANLVCVMPVEIMQSYNSFNNAKLICAANPVTVIALLDEIAALVADKAALVAALKAMTDHAEGLQDEGPIGYGWKSSQLWEDIEKAEYLLAAAGAK